MMMATCDQVKIKYMLTFALAHFIEQHEIALPIFIFRSDPIRRAIQRQPIRSLRQGTQFSRNVFNVLALASVNNLEC